MEMLAELQHTGMWLGKAVAWLVVMSARLLRGFLAQPILLFLNMASGTKTQPHLRYASQVASSVPLSKDLKIPQLTTTLSTDSRAIYTSPVTLFLLFFFVIQGFPYLLASSYL